ncbi:MAG: hypothetical protein AB8B83_07880 [Bdellovibrionales bacterium]
MAGHANTDDGSDNFSITMQNEFRAAGRQQEVKDFARPLMTAVCQGEELLHASVGLTANALQVFKDGPEREFFEVDGPEIDDVYRRFEQGQTVYGFKDGDKVFVAECRPPAAIF